jgi:DNA mismatch repair protein MutS
LARLDGLASLAEVASHNAYVRPQLTADSRLEIHNGRHPVVEHYLSGERYVPNDIVFEPGEYVRVITGPNMSGKSTTLRQAALIVLLAQIGSFVPAESASLGLVDRIFTRIGAQDEIHAGQSTFMVEMVETANILNHATPRSLLVLDEIGRGTSTYDGLSLAWAIIEYIHSHPRLRAKTLFATHYHELTDLANLFPGVRNYNVAVAEDPAQDKVVFLHRIVPGGADRSYGIHVAQMAGLPKPVINRAQEILANLESSSGKVIQLEPEATAQIALFPETNPLLSELSSLDIAALTPLEALNKMYEWQKKFGTKES